MVPPPPFFWLTIKVTSALAARYFSDRPMMISSLIKWLFQETNQNAKPVRESYFRRMPHNHGSGEQSVQENKRVSAIMDVQGRSNHLLIRHSSCKFGV